MWKFRLIEVCSYYSWPSICISLHCLDNFKFLKKFPLSSVSFIVLLQTILIIIIIKYRHLKLLQQNLDLHAFCIQSP
jgi:hypothetical protein